MALRMPSPVKDRHNTYYLRRRVPKDLIPILGKTEVKQSLGTKDSAEAKRRMPVALAAIDAEWASLRAGPVRLTERQAHDLARTLHDEFVATFLEQPSHVYGWAEEYYETLWTADIDEKYYDKPGKEVTTEEVVIHWMRCWCRGEAERYLKINGLIVDEKSQYLLTKAMGDALQRAHRVLDKLSYGYDLPSKIEKRVQELVRTHKSRSDWFTDSDSILAKPQEFRSLNGDTHRSPSISLDSLFEGWWMEAKLRGLKPSTYESYKNTISQLRNFLGHNDAGKIDETHIIAFKDHRLKTPSRKTGKCPSLKTVKDSDLAALKTIFGWAVANRKLESNPARVVTIRLGKKIKLRDKGFTEAEAISIIRKSVGYANNRELASTSAAKKWVPIILAFTGARVGEIVQLRRQDIRYEFDYWVIRITPEAGTQKTNEAREVVLHQQIIDLGFVSFVESVSGVYLFLQPAPNGDVLGPLQGVKNRLAEFARDIVPDANVAPNHGWRHRFRSISIEAGIDSNVISAIQGHAPRSVAERYGTVSLKEIHNAISKLKFFKL